LLTNRWQQPNLLKGKELVITDHEFKTRQL
jgi:hypothetical protein